MTDNPWQVESIQAFYWLKCPECPFDTKEENHFEIHASKNHPLSYVYFGQKHQNEVETSAMIKDEPIIDTNLAENLEAENPLLNSEYQDVSFAENSEYQDFSLTENSERKEISLAENSEHQNFPIAKVSFSENEVNISDQPNFEHTTVKQENIEIRETDLNEDPLNISQLAPEAFVAQEDIVASRGQKLVKPKLKPQAAYPTLLMGHSAPKNLKETKILLSVKEPEIIYPNESFEYKNTLEIEEESKKLDHERKELIKQFKCNLCNAEYTYKGNLQKHIESFHDGKRYDCHICDKSFKQKGNLKYHVESIHEEYLTPFQREDKEKNETVFEAESICSEIELKIEPGSEKSESTFSGNCSNIQPQLESEFEENDSESKFSVNPWDVPNASVFLLYCCPECDFKSDEVLAFSQHAIINHVLSNILFGQINLDHIEDSFSIETETKLELEESDPLSNTNAGNHEFDVDTFVNQEVNVELEPNEKKTRKEPLNIDSLRNGFSEPSHTTLFETKM